MSWALFALLLAVLLGAVPDAASARAGAFEDMVFQQEIDASRAAFALDADPDGPDAHPPRAPAPPVAASLAVVMAAARTEARAGRLPRFYRARAPPLA